MGEHDVRATEDAVFLPARLPGSVDVLLDGRRVWSVTPEGVTRPTLDGELLRVPWPDALTRFLDGRAEVSLRHHQSDRVLFSGEVAFGSGEGRVTVEDDAGRPLAITKYGRLNRPFDSLATEARDHYLDCVDDVLAVLDECGLRGYVAYGTLLGAVRAGRMIGHDVDADVGYLSAHASPADVMRESYDVERALRARGWPVLRVNGGFLAVFFNQPDGSRRNLDVFAGWIDDGWLYQVHDIRARLPRSVVEPLGTVTLEGRSFPAPADPATWLQAVYGPGWATPDPGFTFSRPRAVVRRTAGWLGGLRGRRDMWSRAYAGSGPIPAEPSDFARWAHELDDSSRRLVDLGSGRGEDALWFAARGREVLGVDVVPVVVRRAGRQAEEQGLPARFEELNLADLRHALLLGTRIAHEGPVTIYGRRIIGDLRPDTEANLWRTVGMGMRSGGRLFLEFVTEPVRPDDPRPPVLGAEPERVVAEVVRCGGEVVAREDFIEPDDPAGAQVCRLMAEWSR